MRTFAELTAVVYDRDRIAPVRRVAPRRRALVVPRTHHVRPGPEHLHGWLDPALAPILRIASGDTVVYEDVPDAAWNRWPPGTRADEPVVQPPAGAEHALVGPVYVEGAEPGDVLAIHTREIVPRAWGFGYHKPGPGGAQRHPRRRGRRHRRGVRAARQPRPRARRVACTRSASLIPNRPFMGIFAVAPAGSGRTRTVFPGPYGGNADCKEYIERLDRLSPRLPPGRAVLDG